MKVLILGAAGFIGTNLTINLANDKENVITLVDKSEDYFSSDIKKSYFNIKIIESSLDENTNFDDITVGQDIVYHLVSTNVPTTSNQHVTKDIQENVVFSSKLFDSCVKNKIKKVIFISSGGTVYGKETSCPIKEETPTNPISSYGLQKISIEKLLYLYNHMYGLDYRIIRLANPYGPYQRPNGVLGAVTTFTYKAIKNEKISVYGDGSVIRDFIYIDDAIRGIKNIVDGECEYKTFNLGSGKGTSIRDVISCIEEALNKELNVTYMAARDVDVPINYLDIGRYESYYGKLNPISLREGILKTAKYMEEKYIEDKRK